MSHRNLAPGIPIAGNRNARIPAPIKDASQLLRTDCDRAMSRKRWPGVARLAQTRTLQVTSGRGPGRDRLAHVHRELTVLLSELQIEFALFAVGGELGNQLAFGCERLEPFQPVLKFCHRRVPIKRLKDTQPKPGK